MSQEKIDAYKKEKAGRKERIAKHQKHVKIAKISSCVVIALIVVAIAGSIIWNNVKASNADETEAATTEISTESTETTESTTDSSTVVTKTEESTAETSTAVAETEGSSSDEASSEVSEDTNYTEAYSEFSNN